jgi:hypothetical protein
MSDREKKEAVLRELNADIYQTIIPGDYWALVKKIAPPKSGIDDLLWESKLIQIVFEKTGLQPSEFKRLSIQERVVWLQKTLDKNKGENPPNVSAQSTPGEQLTPEARAILFIQERIKTTGNLPPKTDIAKALDVDRRTLNNWKAFKVAYKQLKITKQTSLPKGSKDKDGNMEACRESGKKST